MAVQSGFLLVLHVLIVVTFGATGAWAESCLPLSEYRRAVLTAEHLFGGKPSSGDILVRRGYVTEYDAVRRVPRWAAWRAAPAYLHAPTRSGRWSTFRVDTDVGDAVRATDYNGLLEEFALPRGHIVPYFLAGGARKERKSGG